MLEGLVLTRRGGSVAVDVAAAHLVELGCRSVAGSGSSRAGCSVSTAGQLDLYPIDGGWPSPTVRCGIDWAGPVDLPVQDEAGVQAACGIMHVHGRRSGAPLALYADFASTTAGVLATQGLLAALVAQQRGLGLRQVTTSVTQAALLAVSPYLAAATTTADWSEPLLPGGPPFTSADGVRFEIEAVHAKAWQRFWTSLEADPDTVARCWTPFQQRFATATCPLAEQLHQATAAHNFASISAAATAAGLSILPVRDRDVPTAPALPTADGPPWRITPLPGPVSAPLPPSMPGIGPLPLEGLIVIESSQHIQGSLAGHLLGLLGASVTRIEPPGGDPLREALPLAGDCSARFLAVNRGKQVIELDLSTAVGRRATRELVAGADVFIHSWAPGTADRWDLDAERLSAVRPGLVYAWASGWGEALGPAPPLGTDAMVQAHSGLAALIGPHGQAPTPSLMTLTEVLGGAICAQGVLAGLLARAHTFRGQRVDSSLLSGATIVPPSPNTPIISSTPDATVAPNDESIRNSLPRPLITADGYLALPGRASAEPDRLATVLRIDCLAGKTNAESIAARFRQESTQTWVDRLGDIGLTAMPVCTNLADIAADPRFATALQHDGAIFPRTPWQFTE